MTTISKFLAIAALVGGVGGALASQGQQDPCTQEGTEGYVRTSELAPEPTLPPGEDPNVMSVGEFQNDFICEQQGPECHWVYDPESPEANANGWIKCTGEFNPNP